jgi:hypothetical protein
MKPVSEKRVGMPGIEASHGSSANAGLPSDAGDGEAPRITMGEDGGKQGQWTARDFQAHWSFGGEKPCTELRLGAIAHSLQPWEGGDGRDIKTLPTVQTRTVFWFRDADWREATAMPIG